MRPLHIIITGILVLAGLCTVFILVFLWDLKEEVKLMEEQERQLKRLDEEWRGHDKKTK
jgi:uncharacterized membrane protein YciS (DUF1049 family)